MLYVLSVNLDGLINIIYNENRDMLIDNENIHYQRK